jgi:hypothetical protein
MKSVRSRENATAVPGGNVIQLRAYRRTAGRRRRRAWWAALFFSVGPENTAQAKSMTASSSEVVKFRRQAGAARW